MEKALIHLFQYYWTLSPTLFQDWFPLYGLLLMKSQWTIQSIIVIIFTKAGSMVILNAEVCCSDAQLLLPEDIVRSSMLQQPPQTYMESRFRH